MSFVKCRLWMKTADKELRSNVILGRDLKTGLLWLPTKNDFCGGYNSRIEYRNLKVLNTIWDIVIRGKIKA